MSLKLIALAAGSLPLPRLPAPHAVWPTEQERLVCVWPRSEWESRAAEAALAPLAEPLLRLREVLLWDELGEPDGDILVQTYFVRRRPDLSYATFEAHYRTRHAPLAREHHPGVARYVQNFLAEPGATEPSFDAVSELWFRSEGDAAERLYRDSTSQAVIAEDVARFLDPAAGLRRVSRPGRSALPGGRGSAPGALR